MSETIYALSSPSGKGGVAIIRVSGENALNTLFALTSESKAKPRLAIYTDFKNPKTQELIDRGIVIYFENPASFTGEDVIEYHIHGGHAGVECMLKALSLCKDTRMAEAGEFTKRAVLNGKIDLTEAEAIADLINAETEMQHKLAIGQHAGKLREIYEDWTVRLTKLLAYQEAEIEFPDEDIPEGLSKNILPDIKSLLQELNEHLNDDRKGERLRDGISVVILGPPNAGKSSLINTLAKRDIAIVSDIAGTTRDILEAHLNLGGYPVIISDTAGLHSSTKDQIEQEGMKRARNKAESSDIQILMFDIKDDIPNDLINTDNIILVANKIDTDTTIKVPTNCIALSVKTGEGLDELLKILTTKLQEKYNIGQNSAPLLTRARHRETLEQCKTHLNAALEIELAELAAEDLRMALRHIGRLTGRVDVEALLDVIFRDFCIGK